MDTSKAFDPTGRCWTNERHVHFLNSMEASFVRTMFENSARLPPLNRYLPDSSESTLDLQKERRRRHSTSDIVDRRSGMEKKTRRLSSEPCTSSHDDQVVPDFGKTAADKKEKEQHA